MASQLTRWLLVALLLTAALFIIRMNTTLGFKWPRQPPQGSAARERASSLAAEWREAEQSRRVYTFRKQLAEELRQRAAIDSPTVAMMVIPGGRLSSTLTDTLRAAVTDAWRKLGLGVTKVGVGVVLNLDIAPVLPGMPRPNYSDNTQLLLPPDSLEPTVCLTMVPIDTFGLQRARRNQDFAGWLGNSFDACAYYARFGVPGPRVRRWLTARSFDVARLPDWNGGRHRNIQSGMIASAEWEIAYGLPPSTLACFAGRAAACAAGLRLGDAAGRAISDGAIALQPTWRFSTQNLEDGEVFLSRVLKAVGPQRFLEFWTTALPVDSALTLALRQPAGEWTGRWQRSYPRTLRVTPRAGTGEVLAGVLEIAVAVGCAILIGQRRQGG